jgi:formate hydrogenlyase subunit 3/multisubunit Na+/H+ antiporter MnhD subunit
MHGDDKAGRPRVRAEYILPALPLTAAAVGLVFLAAMGLRRLRWIALALYTISIPALAFLAYRFWDHHVGPESFHFWQFTLTPVGISFLVPLAVVSPLLLWAVETRGPAGRRGNAASALACLGLAATLAAVMSQHLFLLAGMFAIATWSMAGTAVLKGRKAARLLPYLFPLGAADLCLALGLLLLYLSDPTRGLSFPPLPLRPEGMLAASCSLLLAAALLRLGCFPLHRWMSGIARGSRELGLLHILAVDLTLGTFLLFSVTRTFFAWDGFWVWICLGIAAASLAELARELLHASGREEAWGLLCASAGAAIALVAAPGGQAAAAASRLALWAAVPALALVALGSEDAPGVDWAGVVGSASLMGLPPLAGFAALWVGFKTLAGEFAGGETVIFLAAIPLLFAGALIAGAVSLLLPRQREGEAPLRLAFPAGVLLAACCAAVGIYAGTLSDLFMREYGLSRDIPFGSWTTLAWAVLICSSLALIVAVAWLRKRGEPYGGELMAGRSLPLLRSGRPFPLPLLEKSRFRAAVVVSEIVLYVAWITVMVFLGVK